MRHTSEKSSSFMLGVAIIGFFIIGVGIYATYNFSSTEKDRDLIRAVENYGFTDVELTGWAPFSCSESDTIKKGFKAKNKDGKVLEGAVCCGLVMKGCTVRW